MNKKIYYLLIALGIILQTRLLAYIIGGDEEPPSGAPLVVKAGTVKAIVLIYALSSESTRWQQRVPDDNPNTPDDYDGISWPYMPLWMRDSLIVPIADESNFETVVLTDKYKWSISNFLYHESYNYTTNEPQHILIGDVNPRPTYPSQAGKFFLDESEVIAEYGSNYAYNFLYASGHPYDCIIFVKPHIGSQGGGNQAYCGYDIVVHTNDILSTLVGIISHEYGHCMGLSDKYDMGHPNVDLTNYPNRCQNPYSASEVVGIYSPMETTILPGGAQLTHARPYSPRDKMLPAASGYEGGLSTNGPTNTLGWIAPLEVKENQDKNTFSIPDFATTGIFYKVPITKPTDASSQEKEYFLILNHQKKERTIENCPSWEIEYPTTGVMIWHIQDCFTYYSGGRPEDPRDVISEKRKCEDIECSIGLYDTGGVWPGARTPCPELGYDPIDNYSELNLAFIQAHNGWPRGEGDFFPYAPSGGPTNNSFTQFSNPSSNGYNLEQAINFTYSGGQWYHNGTWLGYWIDAIDYGRDYSYNYEPTHVPENVATHIAITNIGIDGSTGEASMNIKLDCVQSNIDYATASNNARQLVVDQNNILHMVYNSNGHIYYTYRFNNPTRGVECWTPAIPLDKVNYRDYSPYFPTNSKYPAMAFDWDDGINVCWIGPSSSGLIIDSKSLYYSRKVGSNAWETPKELYILGSISTPATFSSPSIAVRKVNTGNDSMSVWI